MINYFNQAFYSDGQTRESETSCPFIGIMCPEKDTKNSPLILDQRRVDTLYFSSQKPFQVSLIFSIMYKVGYKDASPIASKGAVAPEEAIGEASAYPTILSVLIWPLTFSQDWPEQLGNGVSAAVSADQVALHANDIYLWDENLGRACSSKASHWAACPRT